jgi:hypothetical protein
MQIPCMFVCECAHACLRVGACAYVFIERKRDSLFKISQPPDCSTPTSLILVLRKCLQLHFKNLPQQKWIYRYCRTHKQERKHTGRVVCPASSMMQTSNLLLVSKGLVIPRQVTATTLTWSNLSLTSLTLCMFIPVIETFNIRWIRNKLILLQGMLLTIYNLTWKAMSPNFLMYSFMSSNTYKINALII